MKFLTTRGRAYLVWAAVLCLLWTGGNNNNGIVLLVRAGQDCDSNDHNDNDNENSDPPPADEAAAAATTTTSNTGSSSGAARTESVGERYIVTFDDAPNYQAGAFTAGTVVHHRFDASNAIAATITQSDADELQNTAGVLRVEKDPVRYLLDTTTMTTNFTPRLRRRRRVKSSSSGNNNNNNKNKMKPSWLLEDEKAETSTTASSSHRRRLQQLRSYGVKMVQAPRLDYAGGVTLCIVDSGYDLGHEDLPPASSPSGQTVDGFDGNWDVDQNSHGTHVSGIIAAVDNNIGVFGVARGVDLYIVRAFDAAGDFAFESDFVAAVQQCVDNGATVINMSLGGSDPSLFGEEAFQAFYDQGILMVGSAGNDGSTNYNYPGSYDSVISVAAVDRNEEVLFFSQQNDQVELSAAGLAVQSTIPFAQRDATITLQDGSGTVVTGKGFLDQAAAVQAAPLVICGTTESGTCTNNPFDAICILQRGRNITFSDQVSNCILGGGAGAVIYNVVQGACSDTVLSLGFDAGAFGFPIGCVTKSNGKTLKRAARNGASASVAITISDNFYGTKDGTSVAAPFVSGAAALVWSNHPTCTNVEIREALQKSAKDIGDAGRDDATGYGIAKAVNANRRLTRRGCAADNA